MATSVPITVTNTPFTGQYGKALNARFTPAKDDKGELVLCFPDKKNKSPSGQLFSVRYGFDGGEQERVAFKAFVPDVEDTTAPVVDPQTSRHAFFFLEQWVNKDGALIGRRIDGNPDQQTIKYRNDEGEDIWRRKRFHPATVKDVIDAGPRAAEARAAYAQAKADKAGSLTSIMSALGKALGEGNAQLVAGIRSMLDAHETKKE